MMLFGIVRLWLVMASTEEENYCIRILLLPSHQYFLMVMKDPFNYSDKKIYFEPV